MSRGGGGGIFQGQVGLTEQAMFGTLASSDPFDEGFFDDLVGLGPEMRDDVGDRLSIPVTRRNPTMDVISRGSSVSNEGSVVGAGASSPPADVVIVAASQTKKKATISGAASSVGNSSSGSIGGRTAAPKSQPAPARSSYPSSHYGIAGPPNREGALGMEAALEASLRAEATRTVLRDSRKAAVAFTTTAQQKGSAAAPTAAAASAVTQDDEDLGLDAMADDDGEMSEVEEDDSGAGAGKKARKSQGARLERR